MSRLQKFTEDLDLRKAASLRNLGGVVIFLANALSSYLFFIEYGGMAFDRFGQGATLVAGLWGFTIVDLAYMFWHRLKMQDAETVAQVTAAKWMFVCLFTTSVCISGLYFGMATLQVLFVVPEDTMWYLNLFALVFLTAPVIVNIIGFHYYFTNSLESQQQQKRATIRQMMADTQLAEDEKLADLEVEDRERALADFRPLIQGQRDHDFRRRLEELTGLQIDTSRQLPSMAASRRSEARGLQENGQGRGEEADPN